MIVVTYANETGSSYFEIVRYEPMYVCKASLDWSSKFLEKLHKYLVSTQNLEYRVRSNQPSDKIIIPRVGTKT